MLWLNIILVAVTVEYVSAASQYVRCFERTIRRSIDNSRPIVEMFFVSPHQCLDHCILSSNNAVKIGLCKSFVYDHFQHSCRLYDHDGSKIPAIVHPAIGFDLYVRTATTQECAGPMIRFFRDHTLRSRQQEDRVGGFESGASKRVRPPPDGSVVVTKQLPNSHEVVREVVHNPGNPFAQRMNPTIRTTTPTTTTFSTTTPTTTTLSTTATTTARLTTKKPAPDRDQSLETFRLEQSAESREQFARQRDIAHADARQLFDDDKSVTRSANKKTVRVVKTDLNSDEGDFELLREDENVRKDLARTTRLPERPHPVRPSPRAEEAKAGREQPKSTAEPRPGRQEQRTTAEPRPGLTAPPVGSAAREAIVSVLADQLGQILGTHALPGPDPTTALPATTVAIHPAVGQPRPKQIVCPTSLGYYVVAGNELVLPRTPLPGEVHVFEGVPQPKCGQLCSTNRGPHGEHLQCASVNYHHDTHRCELYAVLAEPHGPGALLENSRVIYSEKFCLPAHSGKCVDDDIFILHAQRKVNGHTVGQSGARSIAQCLQACLNKPNCRSATFASTRSLCTLSSADVTMYPALLLEADAGTVVVENGCDGHNRAVFMPTGRTSPVVAPPPPPPVESAWAEWSECKFKVGGGQVVRLRSRSNGALQLQKCN